MAAAPACIYVHREVLPAVEKVVEPAEMAHDGSATPSMCALRSALTRALPAALYTCVGGAWVHSLVKRANE